MKATRPERLEQVELAKVRTGARVEVAAHPVGHAARPPRKRPAGECVLCGAPAVMVREQPLKLRTVRARYPGRGHLSAVALCQRCTQLTPGELELRLAYKLTLELERGSR